MADDKVTRIIEIEAQFDQALTAIAQYNTAIDELRAKQAELKKERKAGTIGEEEYQKRMEATRQAITANKDAAAVLTRQITNQMKVQKSEEGSLVQLRAELSNLNKQYDAMSRAERQGAQGKELLDHITEVTNELKAAEEETQRYYRNVGNYAGAFQGLKEELKNITAQLIVMKENGQGNSEEFRTLMQRAGELKDAIADTQQQISNYASDTGSLDSLKEGITSITQAYAAFKIATDGLGFQNEALDKTFQILAGSLTVINTLTTIQNALQSQSAVMKGVNAVKTWVLNTALGAQAAATTAVTAAEGGATVATNIWTAALYANPIMWLVGIIMAVVAAVYLLVKAFSFWTSDSEKRKDALKEEAKALEDLKKKHEEVIEFMDARGATEAAKKDQTAKNLQEEYELWSAHFEKIKQEYKEDKDEYKEALKQKEEAFNSFQDSLKDGHLYLLKLQTEQREAEKKAALGEYEYKRQLIKKEIEDQKTLAKTLLDMGEIQLEQYNELINSLNAIQARKLQEIDDAENKANEQRRSSTASAAKKRREDAEKAAKEEQEREQKRQEALLAETRKAEEEMTKLIKNNREQQVKLENMAFENAKTALQAKLELYKTNSEYDIAMRKALNTQIEALTENHQRKLTEIEYNASQERIKIQEKILNSKLSVIRDNNKFELSERQKLLDLQYDLDMDALEKRFDDGEINYSQYLELVNYMTTKWQQDKVTLDESFAQKTVEQQRQAFENEIAQMEMNEQERLLKRNAYRELTDEEYRQQMENQLNSLDSHQAEILRREEEMAQQQYDALVARGQLSTQTEEEYNAELNASKQNWLDKQKAINEAYIKNEQAKAQAMKAVTSSLCQLLDTLGEENKGFAIASKVIALAQIAIDTGIAIAEGIKTASSVPFPGNIAAIATTVATVIANIATAVSTVKSAKFAKGGKVNGPGTGTSDSVPAMLSNGEFVMTARATKMFEPLLMAMNNIGSGVPMQVVGSYDSISDKEAMTDSFTQAVQEIHPVVSVVEINETQNRVRTIEALDTF